jgi:hypothetical protein
VFFQKDRAEGIVMDWEIAGLSILVPDMNAEDDSYSMQTITNQLNISSGESVYINWYRFNNIDEMRLDDLERYFDDIWYPGADDELLSNLVFSALIKRRPDPLSSLQFHL